jgi:peptidoglycan/LPS O-acetylase OafA/YrhL
MAKRLPQLDFLRGIAVILVLFRHHWVGIDFLQHIGWVGVDLFFVLSGFLVSGLLFTEWREKGSVDSWRFLIRRGFKIYPLFYLSLFFTMLALPFTVFPGFTNLNIKGQTLAVIGEFTFLQNYLGFIWGHHWSLAVEEHFYLLLAFLLPWLVKHIKFVPLVFVACTVMRYFTHDEGSMLAMTHLRLDSLLMGVCISYVFHFRNPAYYYEKHKPLIHSLMFAPLIAAIFTPLYLTLTCLYVSFGAILVTLMMRKRAKYPRWITWIGYYSYGIYLFHFYLIVFVVGDVYLLDEPHQFNLWTPVSFLIYFFGSIGLGVLMSKLVEIPMLRLRNRLFPTSTQLS